MDRNGVTSPASVYSTPTYSGRERSPLFSPTPGLPGRANHRWQHVSLDEDIEKLFETPPDRESLTDVLRQAPSEATEHHTRCNETDIKLHRGASFPHMHQPLKALHGRPKRHRPSTFRTSQGEQELPTAQSSLVLQSPPVYESTEKLLDKSPTVDSKDTKQRRVGFYLGEKGQDSLEMETSDGEMVSPADDGARQPLMSPSHKPAILPIVTSPGSSETTSTSSPSTDSKSATPSKKAPFQLDLDETTIKSRVSFEVGSNVPEEGQPTEKDADKEPRHRRHKRHKHRIFEDELAWRQRTGSELEIPELLSRVPTEQDEAAMLPEGDLNLMASHRFEDPRGIRRHMIQDKNLVSSILLGGRETAAGGSPHKKLPVKIFDRVPHEHFVELAELHIGEGGETEWAETARWIKYEEDYEEGSDRWGKPHVSSLSFHSLLNLRKCLEKGVLLLDLDEKDLPGIAHRVVEAMVLSDQMRAEDKGGVMRALLLRHKHVDSYKLSFAAGIRRNFSTISASSMESSHGFRGRMPSTVVNPEDGVAAVPLITAQKKVGKLEDGHRNATPASVLIDVKDSDSVPNTPSLVLSDDLSKFPAILRRIKSGSEGTMGLVGTLDFLEQPTIAFVRLAQGMIIPGLLEVPIPVRFLFMVFGPPSDELDYHEVGRSFSTLMANDNFKASAYRAETRRDLLHSINEFLDDSIVLPPGGWDNRSLIPLSDLHRKSVEMRKRRESKQLQTKILQLEKSKEINPLLRTRRLFGGLWNEMTNRYTKYISDVRDAFNPQCFASVVFIYFAALAGAISFGGLMGDKTGNLIGVSETLVVTSICGIVYSLLSGQPLMIIGSTGPVLLFDESLFTFCETQSISFLSIRVWIGLWVFVITLVFTALEGSFLLLYITRFTEEILAALISLIFIYESFMMLIEIFSTHPLMKAYMDSQFDYYASALIHNATDQNMDLIAASGGHITNGREENSTNEIRDTKSGQPNTALLSLILMFGTFFIAFFLREFRNSKYLGRTARRALGDFGVPIAMVITVAVDASISDTYTQKLQVPDGLTPSLPLQRGWIVHPLDIPLSLIFASFLPALLLFMMLFMEVQICELIINKKERKLVKGTGFHMDLLLVSILNMVGGIMGGPWMSAAIVRTISHIMSLTVMSVDHAPGEKPWIVGVHEQRITNLAVSLLVGISVLMSPVLKLIPVSVLFGIFLYMGVVSMFGVQFFERIMLFFMPVKHHPDVAYVRKVRTMKMHIYTLIQLACLTVLWAIKSTPAAMGLPFVLLMMIPLRWTLKFTCFSLPELKALDGSDDEAHDLTEEQEPDFYEEALLPG